MNPDTTSIHQQILQRIKKQKRGTILFPADFADLGGTEAVKKALLRLAQQGLIRRVAFGIYLYPKVSKLLGPLSVSAEEVAQAIASRDKSRIIPTGVYALNRLGLSPQVPLQAVYLTDGAPRKIQVGRRTILFKKTTPKNLAAKGLISGMAIQALKTLGPGNLTIEEEQQLLKVLSKENPAHIKHDMMLAPAWIRTILKKALEHAA